MICGRVWSRWCNMLVCERVWECGYCLCAVSNRDGLLAWSVWLPGEKTLVWCVVLCILGWLQLGVCLYFGYRWSSSGYTRNQTAFIHFSCSAAVQSISAFCLFSQECYLTFDCNRLDVCVFPDTARQLRFQLLWHCLVFNKRMTLNAVAVSTCSSCSKASVFTCLHFICVCVLGKFEDKEDLAWSVWERGSLLFPHAGNNTTTPDVLRERAVQLPFAMGPSSVIAA